MVKNKGDDAEMDLTDLCNYMKAMVISHMPDDFKVAEKFRHDLTDDEIRKGIDAFREFLYAFYDKLSADKDKIDVYTRDNFNPYDKRDKANARVCFPTIFDLTVILFSLGFHGRLEPKEKRLTVYTEDLLRVICEKTEKYVSLIKMSGERKLEMFRILMDLGLTFNGVDFSEEVDFSKVEKFDVTFAENYFFVVGLKLIAEATANHRDYYYIMNVFRVLLECDFHSLANAAPKKHFRNVNEAANAQVPEIKKWIAETDAFLLNNGCKVSGSWEITYTKPKIKNRKGMVLKIWMDITGCFVCPGIGHLNNPNNIISMLPDDIADLLTAKAERECGWCAYSRKNSQCKPGCPIKFTHKGKAYIKCRYSEFRIDLSEANNRELVSKWIEMELV